MVDSPREYLRRLITAPDCLLCAGPSSGLICVGCRAELPWNDVACPRCAEPQAKAPASLCSGCQTQVPPFERAIAAFHYRGAVARAVQNLKYNADFLAARWLGDALTDRVQARAATLPQLLIPVPLHAQRLRERGFNQAQELAKIVARRLPLRLEPGWARRLRSTADQIGLDAVQRRRNVKGAFAIDGRVAGRSVALLDDVMTTGSTVTELARVCHKAGASSVEVWIAARA